jgi:hypothetical protein
MTPLWLAAAVTAPLSEFADAWQPRPHPLAGARRRPARIAAAALVVVPALASAAAGATGSPPLDMRLTSVRRPCRLRAGVRVRLRAFTGAP